MKIKTLAILATCLSVACATLSCGNENLPIFAFDFAHGRIYSGRYDRPKETYDLLNDREYLEKELILMRLRDWTYIKNRLAQCPAK